MLQGNSDRAPEQAKGMYGTGVRAFLHAFARFCAEKMLLVFL